MTAPPIAAQFDSIEDTIAAFKNGEFIVVLDDLSRENEGDLIIAAQDVTPQKMSFMIRHTSGLICLPLPIPLADKLLLPPMVDPSLSEDVKGTAYTVSIDANRTETTTGISASDRALVCNLLGAQNAKPSDFRRPGHVFPLRAVTGGVRERAGHTEAAVEFCRLAGKSEVGVISEIVEVGGDEEALAKEGKAERPEIGMMRRDGCLAFGRNWGLKVCTIEDLITYLEKRDGSKA